MKTLLALLTSSVLLGQTNPAGPNTSVAAEDIFSSHKPSGVLRSEAHKNLSIAPGTTAAVLAQATGSGYVSEIFIATNQYDTEIMVTVDGERSPSIDGNLANFFGDAYLDTQAAFFGHWIQASNAGPGNVGGTFRLPVPFATSVNIQVRNGAAAPAIITSHIVYHTGISDSWTHTQRLHMTVLQSRNIAPYSELEMLNITPNKHGRLAGVGWIYDADPGNASPSAAGLEGAFKIYLDGSSAPSYATAGSEDFFGMPYYFRDFNSFGNGPGSTMAPTGGDVAYTVFNSARGGVTWGAQRFFITDPITFNTGLRFTWTCGNKSAVPFTGTCTLLSTVYYYTEN